MAIDPRFKLASDLESMFINKDTGLPLAGGILYFYSDIARTTPMLVYTISGTPPSYTYAPVGTQITLSSVGTVQDNSGNNIVIYWFPYVSPPSTPTSAIQLYYVECTDSAGNVQFTREGWPNSVS
jgi:hypothetical protein